MEKKLEVCLGESALHIGNLWVPVDGKRAYSIFQYTEAWLSHPRRFAIAPSMPLVPERQFFQRPTGIEHRSGLPPPLADTVPDLWGQRLLKASANQHSVDHLGEADFLVAVDDLSRMGALRLRTDARSAFLAAASASHPGIPPLLRLESITRDIARIEKNHPDREALARIVGAGSSLGGARPKCSVIDADGSLSLAKFTSRHDTRAVEKAEVMTLRLAKMCGLNVPENRLVHSGSVPVAIIRRFDRLPSNKSAKNPAHTDLGGRIPYLSAQSFMNLASATNGTYMDFAEQLRQSAANPSEALRELFSRVSFTILVSNTDDHLKNHGLLYEGQSRWRLSPLFDVNPSPDRARILKTPIADPLEADASIELLLQYSEFLGVHPNEAKKICAQQAEILRDHWKRVARDVYMTPKEIKEYVPAFEHENSRIALSMGSPQMSGLPSGDADPKSGTTLRYSGKLLSYDPDKGSLVLEQASRHRNSRARYAYSFSVDTRLDGIKPGQQIQIEAKKSDPHKVIAARVLSPEHEHGGPSRKLPSDSPGE